MKKTIIVLLSFLMMSLIGCGGKYSDAVEVNESFLDAMIDYLEALEKADNAGKIADAMNEFADTMEVLGPKMREIAEKYPELKDPANQPEEFQKLTQKSEEMEKKFAGSFMKSMKYMNEPEVRKAQQRFSAAMQSMAQ